MLDAVCRYRLYKSQYQDFAEYCKLALGRSHFYCKKIIQAAHICLRLIKANFKTLPTSVSQALPLLKFAKVDKYGDSELQDKWQTVLDGFPPQSITVAKIQEALDENPEDRAKQVRIKGKAYKLLQEKASAAGMSVSEYLEYLIGGELVSEDNLSNDEEEHFSSVRSDEQTVDVEYTSDQQAILADLDVVFKSPDDGCLTQRPKLVLSSGLSPNHPSVNQSAT
ncbi:hypothetical protein QUA03_28555 [Microcoleus sp. S36b_A4]|uniref:hypothetical protein n=1 Tax=Microcoleus sp. S36b_A4 TaxID=3055420 RepID=UPI002FD67E96